MTACQVNFDAAKVRTSRSGRFHGIAVEYSDEKLT